MPNGPMIAVHRDGRTGEVLTAGPDLIYVRVRGSADQQQTCNWRADDVTVTEQTDG